MHNEPNSRLPGEGQTTVQPGEILSSAAQARRRALVKGLGKGGAALATVAPIQSFAAPIVGNRACSVSGIQSGVTSQRPAGTVNCQGWPPIHFYSLKHDSGQNWPVEFNGQYKTLKFSDLFVGDGDTRLVEDILLGRKPAADDDLRRVWIAAYFNAMIGLREAGFDQSASSFPFKASEVADRWNTPETADLTLFFNTYLSQRTV